MRIEWRLGHVVPPGKGTVGITFHAPLVKKTWKGARDTIAAPALWEALTSPCNRASATTTPTPLHWEVAFDQFSGSMVRCCDRSRVSVALHKNVAFCQGIRKRSLAAWLFQALPPQLEAWLCFRPANWGFRVSGYQLTTFRWIPVC